MSGAARVPTAVLHGIVATDLLRVGLNESASLAVCWRRGAVNAGNVLLPGHHGHKPIAAVLSHQHRVQHRRLDAPRNEPELVGGCLVGRWEQAGRDGLCQQRPDLHLH